MNRDSYPCPACGFSCHDEPPGSFTICCICGWEDDAVQLDNPNLAGGANKKSLVQVQSIAVQNLPLSVHSHNGFSRLANWRPFDSRDRLPGYEMDVRTGDVLRYYWERL
jgi:hypothetical protein